MKQLICICCPRGCHLEVDDLNGYTVSGNICPRGDEYGRNEIMNPCRVLTSTVRISGADYGRCPVRTSKPIPKRLLFDAMRLLDDVNLISPVKRGDVVLKGFAGTDADLIVTKDM